MIKIVIRIYSIECAAYLREGHLKDKGLSILGLKL